MSEKKGSAQPWLPREAWERADIVHARRAKRREHFYEALKLVGAHPWQYDIIERTLAEEEKDQA